MSGVRLYLDEDAMRKSLVVGLRARGVDVLTASEAQMIARPDEEHLRLAASLKRALFSFNTADYCVLHEQWIASRRTHWGIVVARQQRTTVSEELKRLVKLVGLRTAAEMQDRLEFL